MCEEEEEFMAIFGGGDAEPCSPEELAQFKAELDASDNAFRQSLDRLLGR